MSFRIKKQKKVKNHEENLSIDFLHNEKINYFKKNKNKSKIEEEMNEYFLNTCDILTEYYEKKDNIKTINPYLENFHINEKNMDLEQRYYKACNINYISNVKKSKNDLCCGQEMILSNESFFACSLCGKVDQLHIDGYTFKQMQENPLTNKFVYKRINYFNDWLKQIQASETSDIPKDLVERVSNELNKRNIRDLSKIKPYLIKEILKVLKEPTYYENINLIISKLTDKPALVIPEEIIQKLKNMFSGIQAPYEELKGPRTNFFSYPYILYKFCELLNLKEYLKTLQLLKSRDKILQHDILWKKIIIEMQKKEGDTLWRFIPSC